MEQQAVIKTVGGQSPCKTCPHGEFLRIAKIVQVSAMKVHFQIAERSLFYLNPYIHLRRMTYPPERDYEKPETENEKILRYEALQNALP
ncbi:MAG: hypothetical protein IK124_06670 [Prevotella sp.]|nr:hypothetical protein [Prevotella sp.]